MNIQACKADEGTCGVTKDDLSFKSASRSVVCNGCKDNDVIC